MEGKNQKQQAEIVKVLFVTRRERGPLRASPFRSGRDVSALPSDWIIAAGHDHCTSSFSKYQILSLPLAFTFFLTLHAHPPPQYLRLSCQNTKGSLVTDMNMGYGGLYPTGTLQKAPRGAAQKQFLCGRAQSFWACALYCAARQRG